MLFKRFTKSLLCAVLVTLVGCGGGGGGQSEGVFSLAITDGPVDNATSVVVEFTGVSIKPEGGEAINFDFDEVKSIDLLMLQGGLSERLVSDVTVPAGNFEWIRLKVNAERDDIMDTYMELDDGTQIELWVPSGSQSGLKLNKSFVIAAGGVSDFTIDFDLRKSITNTKGMSAAILRPTLRIVDSLTVGAIAGTVSTEVVSAACSDPAASAGSVYVYSGNDVTPVDVQGTATDPIASALVALVDDAYSYEIGFVAAGDYTIAYTCDAQIDEAETAEELVFEESTNVSVLENSTTTFDFTQMAEVIVTEQ